MTAACYLFLCSNFIIFEGQFKNSQSIHKDSDIFNVSYLQLIIIWFIYYWAGIEVLIEQ